MARIGGHKRRARTNAQLLEKLYEALDRGDGEAMAECYHSNARFEDPAFGELRGEDVGRMWRMLGERSEGNIEVELVAHEADETSGTAHWIARYPFTATGRNVVNDVHSRFQFRDGKISSQDDEFDLRRWAAQALGPPGKVLGWVGLLGPVIRRRTRGDLEKYAAAEQQAG